MLSKNKLKFLRSLALKKNRDEAQVFLAEGPKIVDELLGRYECPLLMATAAYLSVRPALPCREVVEISEKELSQVSQLKTPQSVVAVFQRDKAEENAFDAPTNALTLALDGVQDPGNLGTIIRLADWFGIEHIFCSPDTADAFSPKTIQATMGAIARVRIHYTDIPAFLKALPTDCPVYGTLLDGNNLYDEPLEQRGVLVMGNEGNGISPAVAARVNRRLRIPSFPEGRPTSESLNVAVATAVACAEFRRRALL